MSNMKLAEIMIESQVRKVEHDSDLEWLAASIKEHGVLQPVLVTKAKKLLAGERRVRASLLAGLTEIPVIVTDKLLTDSEIRLIQLTENIQRADLTGFEKWQGCAELMRMNANWTQKHLAEHLHLSESMILRLLSPSKTTPAWQEALRVGKVGISDNYAASKLPEAEQDALLALKLSGASRDAIEKAGRKSRTAKASAVRLSKVKIAMPNATLVITGLELGMNEIVDLLAETLKEARKASETYDIKTFQSMMADQARGVGPKQ